MYQIFNISKKTLHKLVLENEEIVKLGDAYKSNIFLETQVQLSEMLFSSCLNSVQFNRKNEIWLRFGSVVQTHNMNWKS